MDYMLLVDTAVLAGEIMLESGAETYRVEDTISHFLKKANLKHAHVFVITTGIIATLSDPTIEAITVVRRINRRNTNLNKIFRTNEVSRKFYEEEMGLQEAFHELKVIREEKIYSPFAKNIGIVFTSAFFTLLLGGSILDCIMSAIGGMILAVGLSLGRRIGFQGFLLDGLNSCIVVISVLLLVGIVPFSLNRDLIIIGGIMPMVPGVAITNAIRDTLQGDYVSGSARVMEACMEAAAIAFGACVGMAMFRGVI